VAEQPDQIAALRDKIAECEAEADALGLELVAHLMAMAKLQIGESG
jgi:hypothetical protein